MNKTLFTLFLALLFVPLSGTFAKDHNIVTGNYSVSGVCEQCKHRIENAAYTKGVKFAEWDEDTHILTVKYDSSKTNADIILKNIVKSGHDADHLVATDEDYQKLPSCCRYRTVKKH